jgi:hypothetical protein
MDSRRKRRKKLGGVERHGREPVGFALGEPLSGRGFLRFRAMAVATGVEGDASVRVTLAASVLRTRFRPKKGRKRRGLSRAPRPFRRGSRRSTSRAGGMELQEDRQGIDLSRHPVDIA